MSAEKFMVEFIRALKENDTIGFKQRLRNADLLLIDDVQFIAGKDSTQEEFFHTMNEIITAGRRLVITSDRAPQDLDGIAPRILSRLSWGLVADINPADLRASLQHHRDEARGASGGRHAAQRRRVPRPPGDVERSASSKARSTASPLMR